jgi:hypothetical protein
MKRDLKKNIIKLLKSKNVTDIFTGKLEDMDIVYFVKGGKLVGVICKSRDLEKNAPIKDFIKCNKQANTGIRFRMINHYTEFETFLTRIH